jgi:two-component system chemotaxis response regulator CheY
VADAPQAKTFWKIRVLIVDDETFVRRLVRRMISGLSVSEIVEAIDGQEAIKLLRKFKADIVICDNQMEPLGGLEFLKIIRSGGDPDIRRDLPIIMLTGDTDANVFATAMALDVDAFVKKPIGKDAFAEKIQRCFDVPQLIRESSVYAGVNLVAEKEEIPGQVFDAETMVEKTFTELAVGDVVSMDLMSSTGTLLLAAGMAISATSIGRLQDLEGMNEIKIIVVLKPEPEETASDDDKG